MTKSSGDVSRSLSYKLTLAGLTGLVIALPWWLLTDTGWFGLPTALMGGATVPALLLFAVIRRIRNWSGITALCMIPLTVIGVMDIVANFAAPLTGAVIAVLAITVFLAVLDAGRRE